MKSTKHLFLIIIALISLNVNAQETASLTINIETAGTLPDLIPSSQKNEITNLTLTGFLNGTDIRFIREMAGRDGFEQLTTGNLSVLDLSNARIVAGGENYYGNNGYNYLYTSDDTIGDLTFWGCARLTSINIPNTVTTIGGQAFWSCRGLTTVTIPNSVTKIDYSAFQYCSGLISVTIPKSVTTIGMSAFQGCTSLKEYIVSENNPLLKSIEGVLFSKDGTRLIAYPCNKSNTYTIPNSVTKIDDNAFYGCNGLTFVNIPNSVTTIGQNAFGDCKGLTSITIPNSVTAIDFAFFGCTSLEEFIVSDNNSVYKSIEGVLCNKEGTKLIGYPNGKENTYTVPNSVITIGNNAFYGCSGLTSVIIPSNVIKIEDAAFAYCSGLTFVTIPNSITSIESSTFYGCTALTSVSIPNSVITIKDFAFLGCTGLKSITIQNSVTGIKVQAFDGCKGLTSITIPNSVLILEPWVFRGCTQIKQIYCKGKTPARIDPETFIDIYDTCDLYVPQGANSAYRNDQYWGRFKSIIEQVATSISDIEVSNTNVYTENGYIVVKGGKLGDTVDIYSVSGSLLHKIKITDNIVRINVAPQSLYIVKAGDKSFKIAL